jgi:hypothetical protein
VGQGEGWKVSLVPLIFLAFLLFACARDSDPARAAIDRFIRAAEKRNASEVASCLTADFQGGGMNREQAESMVRGYLAGYEELKISLSRLSIKRGEGVAVASFLARLSGKPANIGGLAGLLPSESSYRFEIRLVPEQDAWKIAWARWEETNRSF